ncbi:SGNH hydrolase [Ophiobolus disseminans]|uniref:SGNH hydrolase n=1 Tax=Ophiobolus disseminans TaxID=1469910 RepID=A0A6A7AKP6_9PLEO|nr:SGNH hydrolase [Ophiobolus disseminans]
MLTVGTFVQPVTLTFAGESLALAFPSVSRINPRDVFDVNRFAYLGDSFVAGPGAGAAYDGDSCFRTKEAWGLQVANDSKLHGPKPIKNFDFIACTGAETKHIYKGAEGSDVQPKEPQASLLKDTNPDLVTLSIGGNDVGFTDLLERCVYRFKHLGCLGCGSFFGPPDDCTRDCDEAMKLLGTNIDSDDLRRKYTASITAIFENAPKSRLSVTGYPRFWNDTTDDCDNVSFKFGCNRNDFLPLIKERRSKMNQLTFRLNDKIKSFITDYQKDHKDVLQITFVDTDPYFKGHRFCEEGVKEPSYRNPDIWFFPFEYSATSKVMFSVNDQTPKGDRNAILNGGGDAGRYFQCLIANSLVDGGENDLQAQPNNVKSDSDPNLIDSKTLPGFLTRIFHPNIKGHTAYKDAFFDAYNAGKDNESPDSPKSGVKCKGLQSNTYATIAPLSDLITNTYCPLLAGMSDSIGTGHYLSGTPEAVDIFAGPSFSISKPAAPPTPTQCAQNLHKIFDECDNDSSANPMDWKAGGEVEVDGWKYSIATKAQRPPAPKHP